MLNSSQKHASVLMLIFVDFNNGKMLWKEMLILNLCCHLKNMKKKYIDIYRHIFLKNIHMVLYVDFLFVCRIALFGQ